MSEIESPDPFDLDPADYDDQLSRGLSISGEAKEFFARGRVSAVLAWWERDGRAAPRRILDLGCAVGDTTALLSQAFPAASVTGLDTSRRLVEQAKERFGSDKIRFGWLAEVDSGAAESADLVYLNGVVHHVEPERRSSFFAALARRVSVGGVLALFENNPVNPGARWVMARIPFDRDASMLSAPRARRWLRAAGLQPLATRFYFYFPHALRFLRRFERPLERIPLGAQYAVFAERPRSQP